MKEIKKLVSDLLGQRVDGHGMDHINRVVDLALKFAEVEGGETEIVFLIALLHEVDDYKLYGVDAAKMLPNARKILSQTKITKENQEKVLDAIQSIGFKKRLNGIIPNTLEAKIVSDADMCDGIGAHSILRTYEYQTKYNTPFFDATIFPMEQVTKNTYKLCADTAVCHFFEKILKLKNYMLTDIGKKEAEKRTKIMIDFLYAYFKEEQANDWIIYLDNFLKQE